MTEPGRRAKTPPRRFLTPRASQAGNGHGYRSDPPRRPKKTADPPHVVERIAAATSTTDEPECVGPAVLDAYGEDARHYQSLRRMAEVQQARELRATLTAAARLADVVRRAKARHVNVSGQVKMVVAMLERAERGGRREPPAALRALTALEARLDGVDDA